MDRDHFSFDELAKLIESVPQRGSQKIVGIDGLGGAGKKTFALALHAAMPHSALVDTAYFTKNEEERVTDTSFSVDPNIDWDRMDRQIFMPLRFENTVTYEKYDSFTDALGESVTLPKDVVIFVFGTFATQNRFAQNYDFTIWIDIPDSIRMTRILETDGEKIWKGWQERVRPIEDLYVSKEQRNIRADLIVKGDDADFVKGYYRIIQK